MLPQAGLQPGALPPGAAGGILAKPMLPPGVTPEQAALPQGIPGLGAPLGKTGGTKPPKAVDTKRVTPKLLGNRNNEDNRRDHSRGDGPGQRGLGGGRQSGGREPGADRRSFGG